MNFLRSLVRSSKRLVGTDQHGNKYFEIVSKGKTKRLIKSRVSHVDYQEGMIPIEWEAWIRGKRQEAPTVEEISKRERMSKLVKQRGIEVELKDKQRQEEEYADGLVAEPVQTKAHGHASAPQYHTIQSSEDAVSSGTDFEPAAWTPPKKAK